MDLISLVLVLVLLSGIVLAIVLPLRAARRRRGDAPMEPVPVDAPFNTLAVVAFVLAFVLAIPAIVCGHLARQQIRVRRERGHGLTTAALILGYAQLALIPIGVIVWYYLTQGAFGF